MGERARLHRKNPERIGPVRNFANLYRQPGCSNNESGANDSRASTEQPRKTPDARPGEGANLAYRVIEKYLNQGRAEAGKLNPQSYGNPTSANPLQEVIDRLLRYQAEMVPLWLDLFGSLARNNLTRVSSPVIQSPGSIGDRVGNTDNPSVEITSTRPIEVLLNLQHDTERLGLATPGLHALEPKIPPLTDIRFISEKGRRRAKLAIKIPSRQPPGVYAGVFIEVASREVRGTLTVRIADSRSAKARPK